MGDCLDGDVEESRGVSREREENFVEHLRGLLGSLGPELCLGVVSRGEPFWKRARRTLSSSKRHMEPKWSRGGNWRATSDQRPATSDQRPATRSHGLCTKQQPLPETPDGARPPDDTPR